MFNNYLHGINLTIDAVTAMVDELEAMDEPVVLVLFGDHKPWGGNGNSAYAGIGADFDLSTLEGFYEYYSTPYLIWANSAAKEALDRDFQGEGGDFSPCFLMNELFEQCGWTGPAFLQYAEEIRSLTPLVHSQGLYLTPDGELTDDLPQEVADRRAGVPVGGVLPGAQSDPHRRHLTRSKCRYSPANTETNSTQQRFLTSSGSSAAHLAAEEPFSNSQLLPQESPPLDGGAESG